MMEGADWSSEITHGTPAGISNGSENLDNLTFWVSKACPQLSVYRGQTEPSNPHQRHIPSLQHLYTF